MVNYTGYYTYNDKKHESQFDVKKRDEKSFYAEGSDDGGKFTIQAKLEKSGLLTAKKQYIGKHSVNWFGRVEFVMERLTKMIGVWELPDITTGNFEFFIFE